MQLERYESNGLELVINTDNGSVFASQSAVARMCKVSETSIRKLVSSHHYTPKIADIPTAQGVRTSNLLDEDFIYQCIKKYNPSLLVQCAKAGLRVYLHRLAGYEVSSTANTLSSDQLVLSKLNYIVEELKLLRPAYEELQTLNKSFDELNNLKQLLEDIAQIIDKPNQKKATIREWLKQLSLDNAVSGNQCKAIGRRISEWLKVGKMEQYANEKKYPESLVPLIKLATKYQLFHAK